MITKKNDFERNSNATNAITTNEEANCASLSLAKRITREGICGNTKKTNSRSKITISAGKETHFQQNHPSRNNWFALIDVDTFFDSIPNEQKWNGATFNNT